MKPVQPSLDISENGIRICSSELINRRDPHPPVDRDQ